MTPSQTPSSSPPLYLQSNSPGEINTWVIPISKRYKAQFPQSRITVFLTPCQYASGGEKQQLLSSGVISHVYTPKETLAFMRKSPFLAKEKKKGFFLFLGGDPLYGRIISLKLGVSLYGYSETLSSLGWFYKTTFTPKTVGHLMAERILRFDANVTTPAPDCHVKTPIDILFFTGSRPQHFKALFPFVCDVVTQLQKNHPELNMVVQVSPFIKDDDFHSTIKTRPTETIQLYRGDALYLMSQSSLLVTLAGTSTAEAMYMRLPMIALVPLNFPDLIIFDGLLGILGNMPFLGPLLKKVAISILKKKKRFYAHPNNAVKKAIVPEIKDVLEVNTFSKKVFSEWVTEKETGAQKQALSKITLPPSPADTIISTMTRSLT